MTQPHAFSKQAGHGLLGDTNEIKAKWVTELGFVQWERLEQMEKLVLHMNAKIYQLEELCQKLSQKQK